MLQPGDKAPDFFLPRMPSGDIDCPETESLADLVSGGAALLILAKTACPTCQYLAHFLGRFDGGGRNSRVSVRLILQASTTEAETFLEEWSPRVAILLDEDPFPVSEAFNIRYVPSGFLVSQTGLVENSFESFVRSELEEIDGKIRIMEGWPQRRLFESQERVPAFRPG